MQDYLSATQTTAHERSQAVDVTVALIRRYQDGESAALGDLFERYYKRVLRIVHVKMSPSLKAKMDPEDIVNSTLAKAFEIFDRFEYREPASVIHWLSRIALNKIRDEAKRFQNRPEQALEAMGGQGHSGDRGFDPAGSVTLPPERASRAETAKQLDECLGRLEGQYREVILLRDYEDGSWEYVGEALGRSAAAARMLHVRAKQALLKELKQGGLL